MIPRLVQGAAGSLEFGVWRSLVAHLLWEQGVGGSNPSTPTNFDLKALATQRPGLTMRP